MTQTVKKNYSPNKCKLVQLLWKKSMTVPQKLKRKLPFSSVAQSYPTLCDPTDCNTPGFPVYHQLLEFTQTHVHWVGDAIQPPHPLSSPSPPTFNLSQHQGLFQWVSSSHQVAKALGVSASHTTHIFNFYHQIPSKVMDQTVRNSALVSQVLFYLAKKVEGFWLFKKVPLEMCLFASVVWCLR